MKIVTAMVAYQTPAEEVLQAAKAKTGEPFALVLLARSAGGGCAYRIVCGTETECNTELLRRKLNAAWAENKARRLRSRESRIRQGGGVQ